MILHTFPLVKLELLPCGGGPPKTARAAVWNQVCTGSVYKGRVLMNVLTFSYSIHIHYIEKEYIWFHIVTALKFLNTFLGSSLQCLGL